MSRRCGLARLRRSWDRRRDASRSHPDPRTTMPPRTSRHRSRRLDRWQRGQTRRSRHRTAPAMGGPSRGHSRRERPSTSDDETARTLCDAVDDCDVVGRGVEQPRIAGLDRPGPAIHGTQDARLLTERERQVRPVGPSDRIADGVARKIAIRTDERPSVSREHGARGGSPKRCAARRYDVGRDASASRMKTWCASASRSEDGPEPTDTALLVSVRLDEPLVIQTVEPTPVFTTIGHSIGRPPSRISISGTVVIMLMMASSFIACGGRRSRSIS